VARCPLLYESTHGSKEDIMTKLKTLAVTGIATLAIGAGGLAAAPSASAQPRSCADVAQTWLAWGNRALAEGRYNAAWNYFERASEVMKHC
jgi:outer membrane protein assembly factor BamD (BamD/ComL family)